jgi:predicted RNA binding protein YcfA (HicA-like mRNA interferase family)
MSTTIKQLFKQLEAAGFINRGGKGRHKSFRHSRGVNITLSGKDSEEAKPYQIAETTRAIEKTRNEKE